MRIASSEEGLGCQSVYRVIGVLDSDVKFYTRSDRFGYDDFSFESVMAGSGALAIHADRNGMKYETDTNDVDLYTVPELTDLDAFEALPQAKMTRDNGSQYGYNISASARSNGEIPDVMVDVITDFEGAFLWSPEDAEEVGQMLEDEVGASDPMFDDAVTVYLPGLETLRETFERSGRDYEKRIELIDSMM